MSAPIAISAVADAAVLPFTSSTSSSLLAVAPVGMWAKASISPLSELARGSGGSAAVRQSRSSTFPQAFLVNLPRRAIAEALVLAFLVVEAEPGANAGLRLGDRRIGVEVDLLVFQAAPHAARQRCCPCSGPPPSRGQALAVHADRDPVILQGAGEVVTGELAAPSLRWGRLWSVLKISGRPYRESASSIASIQKSPPSVFDSRHANTARLTQSMTTTR